MCTDSDPWEVHAIYFSNCEYLITMKGQDYINSILERVTYDDEEFVESINDKINYLKITEIKNDNNGNV